MKKIIVLFTTIVVIFTMVSCASIAGKVGKIDASIGTLLNNSDKNISIDCRAGLATGITIAPDTTASVRATVQALQSVANKDSEDYKKCFALGAWTSFLVHGTKDLSDKILSQLMTFGVLK